MRRAVADTSRLPVRDGTAPAQSYLPRGPFSTGFGPVQGGHECHRRSLEASAATAAPPLGTCPDGLPKAPATSLAASTPSRAVPAATSNTSQSGSPTDLGAASTRCHDPQEAPAASTSSASHSLDQRGQSDSPDQRAAERAAQWASQFDGLCQPNGSEAGHEHPIPGSSSSASRGGGTAAATRESGVAPSFAESRDRGCSSSVAVLSTSGSQHNGQLNTDRFRHGRDRLGHETLELQYVGHGTGRLPASHQRLHVPDVKKPLPAIPSKKPSRLPFLHRISGHLLRTDEIESGKKHHANFASRVECTTKAIETKMYPSAPPPMTRLPKSKTLAVLSNFTASISKVSLSSSERKVSGSSKASSHLDEKAPHVEATLNPLPSLPSLSPFETPSPVNETEERRPEEITDSQPSAYWAGRFLALQDRLQAKALPSDGSMLRVARQSHGVNRNRPTSRPEKLPRSNTCATMTTLSEHRAVYSPHLISVSNPVSTAPRQSANTGASRFKLGRLGLSETRPMSEEDDRCVAIFRHLQDLCVSDEAARSLWDWQQAFAREKNKAELLPIGGTLEGGQGKRSSGIVANFLGRHGKTTKLIAGNGVSVGGEDHTKSKEKFPMSREDKPERKRVSIL